MHGVARCEETLTQSGTCCVFAGIDRQPGERDESGSRTSHAVGVEPDHE
jgi:hypothetical protein